MMRAARQASLLGYAGYLPKSRAKLQDNYNVLNEGLRENGRLLKTSALT
jgi:hypothetical protein